MSISRYYAWNRFPWNTFAWNGQVTDTTWAASTGGAASWSEVSRPSTVWS